MKASMDRDRMISESLKNAPLPRMRFAVYIDVRGSEDAPKEMSAILPTISPDTFRWMMTAALDQCLDAAKSKGLITEVDRHGSDSRLAFSRAADDVYDLLNDLWELGLPLEIAIDFRDFGNSSHPFFSDEIVEFLKKDILRAYSRWFRTRRGVSPIRMVLGTERAFLALGGERYWSSPYRNANFYCLKRFIS